MEDKILLQRLSKSRQGHLGYITRLCNELDSLIQDYSNVVKAKEASTRLNEAFQSCANHLNALDPVALSEQSVKLTEEENTQVRRVKDYQKRVNQHLKDAREHYKTRPDDWQLIVLSAPPTVGQRDDSQSVIGQS